MQKREWISLLSAVCVTLSCFGGCLYAGGSNDPKENPGYSTVVPVYTDDKQMEIMAFWSPPITQQQYTWMKDCGITSVVVDWKYDGNTGVNRRKILSMCNELGIDVYFSLDRFQDGTKIKTFESFLQYDSFAGFYCDEPVSKTHIDNVADQAKKAYMLDPELQVILNMVPEYSSNGKGYEWIYTGYGDYNAAVAKGDFFANYEEYVLYVQDVVLNPYSNAVVTATNYPLAEPDRYEITLDNTWLNTLGLSKQIAVESGRDMLQFIATTGYHSGGFDWYHRQPTEADIRWMSYTALAYGAIGIMEFVYTTVGEGPEFDADHHGAIWWKDINDYNSYYRTDVWYAAQRVHKELQSFDHVLLSFDWQGVLCHNVTNDPSVTPVFQDAIGKLEGHKRIEKIDSTGDLLIGCFMDDKDYDGFMVVNFTETAYNSRIRNEVSITFDYAKKALVYISGQEQLVELKNHTFTYTLLPGQGFFIIPVA